MQSNGGRGEEWAGEWRGFAGAWEIRLLLA